MEYPNPLSFRWWDVPGESCNLNNPEFKAIVSASHGCCIFINADALVHDKAYLLVFEDIIDQVVAIASLVSLNGFKICLCHNLYKVRSA